MGLFPKISITNTLFVAIIIVVAIYIYMKSEGFDVNAGSSPAAPGLKCPMGFWCPVSSGQNKGYRCPGGTFGSATGLSVPACSGVCKAGCVCAEGSTNACAAPCPAGYYCVEGTGGGVPPLVCPEGYYCPISSKEPIICPKGVLCPPGTTGI